MAVINSSRFNLKEGIDTAIMKYLEEYSGEVVEATEKTILSVAQDSVKKLKAESPKGKGKGKHQYAKGWTYQVEKGRMRVGAVIYGKKGTYNLAHLLEYGHQLRRGGRKTGDAKAIEHIKPVEKWAIEEFERRLINEIEWGS